MSPETPTSFVGLSWFVAVFGCLPLLVAVWPSLPWFVAIGLGSRWVVSWFSLFRRGFCRFVVVFFLFVQVSAGMFWFVLFCRGLSRFVVVCRGFFCLGLFSYFAPVCPGFSWLVVGFRG